MNFFDPDGDDSFGDTAEDYFLLSRTRAPSQNSDDTDTTAANSSLDNDGGAAEGTWADMNLMSEMASSWRPIPVLTHDPLLMDDTELEGTTAVEGMDEKENPMMFLEEFGPLSADIKFMDERIIVDHVKYKLFTKFRPRQFFVGSVLHREKRARKVLWDELFMDLIFIAVLNKIVNTVRYAPIIDGDVVNRFILLLYPVWSSWCLVNGVSNRFGISGFGARLIYWFFMILIYGIGIQAAHVWNPDPSLNTESMFVGIYCGVKIVYIFEHALGCLAFPKFTPNCLLIGVSYAASMLPYIVSCFDYPIAIKQYLCIEPSQSVLTGPALRWTKFQVKMKYRLAINIEHYTERWGGLTLIVLGEMVVSLLWPSSQSSMSTTYLATIMGLIVSIAYAWLYFNIDSARHYTHALRRNGVSAMMWQASHLPLHISTTLAGAAMSILITQVESSIPVAPIPLKELWLGNLAISMFFMAVISISHKGHDHHVRVPSKWRALGRIVVAMTFVLLAVFADELSPLSLLALPAGVMLAVVIFEDHAKAGHSIATSHLPSISASEPYEQTDTFLTSSSLDTLPPPATQPSDYDPPPFMRVLRRRTSLRRQRTPSPSKPASDAVATPVVASMIASRENVGINRECREVHHLSQRHDNSGHNGAVKKMLMKRFCERYHCEGGGANLCMTAMVTDRIDLAISRADACLSKRNLHSAFASYLHAIRLIVQHIASATVFEDGAKTRRDGLAAEDGRTGAEFRNLVSTKPPDSERLLGLAHLWFTSFTEVEDIINGDVDLDDLDEEDDEDDEDDNEDDVVAKDVAEALAHVRPVGGGPIRAAEDAKLASRSSSPRIPTETSGSLPPASPPRRPVPNRSFSTSTDDVDSVGRDETSEDGSVGESTIEAAIYKALCQILSSAVFVGLK
ncbi:hypothetical protein HK101_001316 [Irineochytrium annulatum]|nr:hypothetical protein HK101_001316 [Irineochytrium annulatum]